MGQQFGIDPVPPRSRHFHSPCQRGRQDGSKMAARCQHCVSGSKGVLGRPKQRPRHQFSPSKAKAQQTCYTAIMNLTQCPPNISITPTMSTCSEKKPAQSPPAAPPPAPPTVCAAATGKKSASASHGAPTPPSATAAAKNAATTTMPAPPAAPKKTGAANAHLDFPSKNQSHRLCRPLCRKLCRKHQNAPFSQKLRLIFKKNRDKTSPYLSCHDRSHLYPVTEQKILAKNQHLLTSFAAIRYPFDTLPVCPQPPAMEAAASRPGHSWPRPAPPSPRAAAPPAMRSSPSSTTVSRAEMLHCAAWPQVRFSTPGPLDSPALGWTRRIITKTLTVKPPGVHPGFWGRPQWLVSDSSATSQRLSKTHPHSGLHPCSGGASRIIVEGEAG